MFNAWSLLALIRFLNVFGIDALGAQGIIIGPRSPAVSGGATGESLVGPMTRCIALTIFAIGRMVLTIDFDTDAVRESLGYCSRACANRRWRWWCLGRDLRLCCWLLLRGLRSCASAFA